MQSRPVSLALTGIGVLQCAVTFYGISGWQCPFLHGLGVPCPGCGLSRAAAALFRGDWQQSLHLHAFAPLALVALLLIALGALLPARQRRALVGAVAAVERRSGLGAALLIVLIAYWLIRLAAGPAALTQLLKG